jgi:hypothetical protein
MKIRIFGLVILSLCLMSTISPISAGGIYATYMTMDSYTVHHGENVTVKVELYSDGAGILGTDGWIDHAKLDFRVLKKDKDGSIVVIREKTISTNLWANAYYTIDTSDMEPGQYALTANFPWSYNSLGDIFLKSERLSSLTVT